MGFCLYGNDIDDTTSPLEAGLGWITKFTKDFTAKEILEKQKEEGVERKLVGFEMIEKGIPRHGYEIKDYSGTTIGVVTSGTQSPSLEQSNWNGICTNSICCYWIRKFTLKSGINYYRPKCKNSFWQ